MTGIRISTQTASAMLTQMVRGGKAEINVLLGDMATMPLSPVDEASLRCRVEEALAGMHPDTTAACTRHLGMVRSCAMDVSLLRGIGLEPSVVSFIVSSMGSLDVTAAGTGIHFSQGPARLDFDLPIGAHAVWSAGDEHSLYIGDMPATVATLLDGRIADGRGSLTDVIRHPVLDGRDLAMERVRTLSSGGMIIMIADHPAIRVTRLEDLLGEAGAPAA